MDFVLDPAVAAATAKSANNSSETLTEPKTQAQAASDTTTNSTSTGSQNNSNSNSKTEATPEEIERINKKTEEEFNKLEDKIEETYNLMQKATSGWGSSLTGFWSKVKIPESLSLQETQKKLEELKSNLPEAVAQRRKQVEELAAKGGEQLNQQFNNLSLSLSEDQKKKEEAQSGENRDINNIDNKGKDQKKMLDILTKATNSYLDDLDHELEQVEKFAGSYATKVSSFIKTNLLETDAKIRERLIEDANKGDLDANESNLLFNVPDNIKTPIYATRTEAQLHALHTSQDLYVTDAIDSEFATFLKSFNLESKTAEISSLLKKHSQLQNLMAAVVPTKVSYEEFWARYFFMYGKILEQEEKRKKILENNADDGDDEDFNWDDDDDDDDDENGKNSGNSKNKDNKKSAISSAGTGATTANVESRTSSELTYDLKSTNSSTLDVVASKKAENAKSGANDDDDDDDDWE